MPYNENGLYHKEKEKCVIRCAMCHRMKKHFQWGYQTIDRRRKKNETENAEGDQQQEKKQEDT